MGVGWCDGLRIELEGFEDTVDFGVLDTKSGRVEIGA